MKRQTLVLLLLSLLPLRADQLRLTDWDGFQPSDDLAGALAWADIATQTSVAAKDAPTDWTPYQTLSFRAHVAEPKDSLITLVMSSENPATKGSDYYAFNFGCQFSGWRTFQVALKTLGGAREPLGWDQIGRVFFSSNWSHHLDPETKLSIADFTLDTEPIPGTERPAGELLTNRSFELDGNRDGTPDGWGLSTFDGDCQIGLDDQVAQTGATALRIVGVKGSRAGATVGFGEDQTAPQAAYLLSAWVKTEGESDHSQRASARITSVGADGKVLKSDYRACDTEPQDWRRYEWLVTLPPETTRFNLVLFHHGSGTTWWDDVSLRQVYLTPATEPAYDATIADPRPTFAWTAVEGIQTIELSADESFPPETTQRWEVTGNRFTPPVDLPQGHDLFWRVVTVTPDDKQYLSTHQTDPAETTASRFFAGTWEQRMQPLTARLAALRHRLEPLKQLADRNSMYDRFTRFDAAIAVGEALAQQRPENPAEALAKLEEDLSEVDLFCDWWDKIFLGDAELFSGLDLDRPGLEAVKAAVATEDWAAARLALRDYYRARTKPSWYARYEGGRPQGNPDRPFAKADAYLTHQFTIHDYETPTYDLGAEFDWHVFPIIDVEWPTKIHRCFHWESIADAWWQGGNEKYPTELRRQLLDFAADNPLERWNRNTYRWAWSTLNATVRIYSSWLSSWLRVRDAEAWTPDAQFVFLTELREHGRFLMANHAKTGNWVVAEARGLVELGLLFPEFKEAKEWMTEGYRRLERELDLQVLADGVHVERTPGYHSMTLSCFMEPVRLGLLNGVDIPGREHFVEKLEQMHELYLYGSKPNHRMAQIGDSSRMNVDGMMNRGDQMFRRLDMRYLKTEGREGEPPVHRSYAFWDSGFYVNRSAWCDPNALWSILDWGGFVGHCHDDMGHVSVYAYGSDLLVDTGIFAYAWPLRAPFHDTSGHNTVMVDQVTQKRRDPLTRKWVTCDQFDVFSGTTDNSEPLQFERTNLFRQPSAAGPGYWLVIDRLTGDGQHRLDQRWHANDLLRAKLDGTNVVLSTKDGEEPQASLVIAPLSQPNLRTAVEPGFVSYAWYKKTPIDVVQMTLDQAMPGKFVTVLYPTPPDTPPAKVTLEAVSALLDGQPAGEAVTAVSVTIEDRGQTYHDLWLVNHTGAGSLAAGGLVSDGRTAYLRSSDGAAAWGISEGSRLMAGERELFRAGAKVDAAGGIEAAAGTLLTCTGGTDLRFAVRGAATLNGIDVTPQNDLVTVPELAAPVVPRVPKEAGEPRFEIEPPPPPMEASGTAVLLPKDASPTIAAQVEAEAFGDQGGGTVEVTDQKVGAQGQAFLHWDREGHWLEWVLDVPQAGDYRVLVRGCTSEGRILRKLTVNGETPAGTAAIELLGTGGYSSDRDDWRIYELPGPDGPLKLNLPAGPVKLRLENLDGHSLNLDWLALSPAG